MHPLFGVRVSKVAGLFPPPDLAMVANHGRMTTPPLTCGNIMQTHEVMQ